MQLPVSILYAIQHHFKAENMLQNINKPSSATKILYLFTIQRISILCDFISLSNELNRNTKSRGLPTEYSHFHELDNANIKSYNCRCSIHLIRFDLHEKVLIRQPFNNKNLCFLETQPNRSVFIVWSGLTPCYLTCILSNNCRFINKTIVCFSSFCNLNLRQ